MMRLTVAGLLVGMISSAPAVAEVKRAAPGGFEVESRVIVPATPQQAFLALGQPQQWWDPDHSYSGSSANLRLGLKAGDCFCEAVPADGGTIEHGRVIQSRPGATLRLNAALGPLQAEAVTGTLTWTFRQVPGGTEVTQNYVVGGYFRQSGEPLARPVDQVLTMQLARYREHLARAR